MFILFVRFFTHNAHRYGFSLKTKQKNQCIISWHNAEKAHDGV